MSHLHRNMRLLPVLLVFSLIEAKRRQSGDLVNTSEDFNKKHKTNDVDVYPENFETVDFGHVYKDKNKDPNFKQTDIFGPDMTGPRNVEHARQLLRQAGRATAKKVDEPLGFASPRDAMLFLNQSGRREAYESDRMAYPPARIRNIPPAISQPINEEMKRIRPNPIPPIEVPVQEKIFYTNLSETRGYFSRSGFDLLSGDTNYEGNWTTCKEFAKGAVFHPDDIMNLEWVPFYIWSKRQFMIAHVHTFSYLTKKLVQQYKEKYGPYLNIKVDWEEPKFLMKELTDMLLIAGDRKGLFYGIQLLHLPDNIKKLKYKVPVIVLRLKIVDPYLALMYCNEKYAVIMSVAGNEPGSNEEKMLEANKALKFKGIGNPAARDLKGEMIRAKYRKDRRPSNTTA